MLRRQRKLSEICAYYRLTKKSRDVYVEGPTDAKILNRAFLDCGRNEVIAYPVEYIDFDTLPEHTLPRSNRTRCLILAEHLRRCENIGVGRALVVIDADFDIYDGFPCHAQNVIRTEYADLIQYFCNPENLYYPLVHLIGGADDVSAIIDEVRDIAQQVFAVRHACRNLEIAAKFPDPAGACEFVEGRIQLNQHRLIAQIVNQKNEHARQEELRRLVGQFHKKVDLDPRCVINGHDFVAILRYSLTRRCRARVGGDLQDAVIEAMIIATQSAAKFCETPLIGRIFSTLTG